MTLLRSRLLHGGGLLLTGLAWACAHALSAMEAGHTGHEPALAYPMALVTFLLASAGVALAVMGPRLFRKVVVADRWLPHVPVGFRASDSSDDPAPPPSEPRNP